MRSAVVVTLVALLVVLLTGACHIAAPCDPADWLFSECGSDESCDAVIRRCMPRERCKSSADCFDGFVCYSDGTCARNCNRGISLFEYCIAGYTCDPKTYQCIHGRVD